MAQPSNVVERARAIHSALRAAGWGDDLERAIQRRAIERFLVTRLGMAPRSTEYVIDAGKMLGLWTVVPRNPWPAVVLVHPIPEEDRGLGHVHATA